MIKHEDTTRCLAPQMLEIATREDSADGKLLTFLPAGVRQADPWPAFRQSVHAYARDPIEENALAVEVSMRFLQHRHD